MVEGQSSSGEEPGDDRLELQVGSLGKAVGHARTLVTGRLVVGFPALPVMATTWPRTRCLAYAPQRARLAATSSTWIIAAGNGPPPLGFCATMARSAPALAASPTNAWPSTLEPRRAK